MWNSANRFWRKNILTGFYHIGAWWPSWSCDQYHVIRFSFLVPESFHTKFGSDRYSSF